MAHPYRHEVYAKQLEILFAATPHSVAMNLVVAAIAVAIHRSGVAPLPLGVWFVLLVLVLGGRFLLFERYRQAAPAPAQSQLWGRKFLLGTSLTALLWGASGIICFPSDSLVQQTFTMVVLTGLAAGALTSLAADHRVYTIYALLALGPVAGMCLAQSGRMYLALAGLLVLLLFFLIQAARRINDSITTSLIYGYENHDLLKALEKEKNRLGSRLSRILNDFSTEIYIIDMESLAILQANAGAALNLGYSLEELQGLHLPEINLDLSREHFRELLARGGGDEQTPLVVRGEHRRKNGSRYPIEARFQVSHKETPPVCVATVIDDTERRRYEERLLHQANYDQLTGLPNKKMALELIERALACCSRKQYKGALLFLDLDNFKNINDSMGHSAGDELLRQVAHRLTGVIRKTDSATHLSGDEFLIILEDLQDNMAATPIAQKIFAELSRPYHLGQREIFITASIGISSFPDNGTDPETLVQHADTAMYSAKAKGRNNFQYFNQAMNDALTRHLRIESELRKALAGQRFELFFQPQCETDSGAPVAAEALLRWHSEELGMVSPAEFIPVAEHCGLIVEIGNWVLAAACREAAGWSAPLGQPLRVAINISARQFRDANLVETVSRALAQSGLPPQLLELEITESLLMQDHPEIMAKLVAFRAMGIQLALDDFGTGYSSLSYLKRFPIQTMKIDRSFVSGLEHDSNDQALVSAIVNMGHSLNLQVVAEGVETAGQLGYLADQRVELIQGYLMSRPLPAQAFRDYLRQAAGPALAAPDGNPPLHAAC